MMKAAGFHHVALRARDFEKSLRFYTQGLRMKERLRWGEGDSRAVMLDAGNGNFLEIFAGGRAGMEGREGTLLHFALRTTDCEGLLGRAREAGAEVTMEPTDVDIPSVPVTSVRIAFCKGPDGEVIELFQSRGI
jgi:glyoxylase I family protein